MGMKTLIFFLIIFLFFFTVKAIEVNVDPNIYYDLGDVTKDSLPKETVTYTPNTETHCIDNKCTQTIYSGARFADSNGTKVENAKTLKDIWQKQYLEIDPDFDIDVVEVNYTYIELNLSFNSSNYAKYPECGSSKANDIKCDFKLTEKETVCSEQWNDTSKINETICNKVETKTQYKYQEKNGIKADMKYVYKGMSLGKEFTFGGNSTTIAISVNDTGGADCLVESDLPNINANGDPFVVMRDTSATTKTWERTYIRFNISTLPSNIAITSANLTINEHPLIISVGVRVNVYHMNDTKQDMWGETTITWNNQPCGKANVTLNGSCNSTAESSVMVTNTNSTFNFAVTNMVKTSYASSKNFTVLLANLTTGTLAWASFDSRENTNPGASADPYITVSYTELTPPTYSLNSTNSTLAGTPILHSLNWTDNVGLSSYIFSFDNATNISTDVIGFAYNPDTNDAAVFFRNGSYSNGTSIQTLAANIDFDGALKTFTYPADVDLNNVVAVAAYAASVDDCAIFLNNGTYYSDTSCIDLGSQIDFASSYSYTIPSGYSFNDIIGVGVQDAVYDVAVFFKNGSFAVDASQTDFASTIAFATTYGFTKPSDVSTDDVLGITYDGDLSDAAMLMENMSFISNASCTFAANIKFATALSYSAPSSYIYIDIPTWVNDTVVSFNGGTWSNVTKVVNSTSGAIIRWCVYANDSSNNWNGSSCYGTSQFTYTTTGGVTYPQITTQSPTNTTYASGNIWANVTLNEAGSWCGVNNDTNPTNLTMSNTTGNWNYNFNTPNPAKGSHTYIFYCNDSTGGMNTTNVTFTIDNISPQSSNVGTNNTSPTMFDPVLFYSNWTDNVALSHWIFSWNGTGATCGTWANDTAVAFTGSWANVTKTYPIQCLGQTVDYEFYVNDTSNNWNNTAITVGGTEITPITYSLNSTNSTIAGSVISHNLYWQDNGGLSGYIFSFCNGNDCLGDKISTTISINDTDADGYVRNSGTVWYTVQNAVTGDVVDNDSSGIEDYGAADYLKPPTYTTYYIYRTFLYFDTSSIPDNAIIDNVILTFKWCGGTGTNNITAQKGTQGDILSTDDYDAFTGAIYSNINDVGYSVLNMTFNQQGKDDINKTGTTKICLRDYQNDYINTSTGVSTGIDNSVYYADSGNLIPYLNITYTITNLVNDTWVPMTGIGNWSNVTKTVNSTVGTNITWCVYANDTSNNWNGSSCTTPFSYVTTSAATNISFILNFTGYQNYYSTSAGVSMATAQFNSSTGSEKIVNVSIVADVNYMQNDIIPMFNITNIGNTNANVSICLNQSMPSSMVLFCTYNNNPFANVNLINTSCWNANSSLASNANQNYWCWLNFTSAVVGDTTQRIIYINATD